jgi:zinc transporter 5/7
MWVTGLSLCGPLRTVLLFHHSDIAVLAAVGVLTQGGHHRPSRFRGSVLFFLALVTLLFFDNDTLAMTEHRILHG